MTSAKTWLIINPTAGRNNGDRVGHQLKDYLATRNFPVTIHEPAGEDKFTDMARRALHEGVDNLILAGGDGTFNLAINCLLRAWCEEHGCEQANTFPELPLTLGFIPTGTGNDFIKATAIPGKWQAACDVIIAGKTRTIDLGRVKVNDGSTADKANPNTDWHYFLNNIASGLDAQVGITATKVPLLRGNSVYLAALAYHLWKGYAGNDVEITFADDSATHRGPIGLCAVSNGVCYGGTFNIAPEAKLDDGLFSIVLAEWRGRFPTIKAIAAVLKGTHHSSPVVTTWQSSGVTVKTTHPIPLVTDGELVDASVTDYTVELLSRSARIFDGQKGTS